MREAQLRVDEAAFAEMGIEELVSLFREAGIRSFDELACEGTEAVLRIDTSDRVDPAELDALDYVGEWDEKAGTDGHRYVVAFEAPGLPETLAERADDLVGTCDPDLTDGGVGLSLTGPQEAIAGTVDGYEAAGIAPDLRRLGAHEGPADPLADLTARQREVLRTAWTMGHYEVPSEASTADLAAELDLDPSTVAEHLQRAERNLLAHHLE